MDASYRFGDSAQLSGYGYFLELDDAPGLSNRTLGFRLTGSHRASNTWSLPYVVEYARQTDHGNSPSDYEADYYLIEAGVSRSSFGVRVGHEILEGGPAPGAGFQTPLTTLHLFQGWADKFLSTPTAGIEDSYIKFDAQFLNSHLVASYHDFAAETGGGRYGDEIDLSMAWSFSERYSFLLKFASYRADEFAMDSNKIWGMLTLSF